jgi:hypothetical protein
MADCCPGFKEIEHIVRNAEVVILHHSKEIQKQLAVIDAALNCHKCDRPAPDILIEDMPDILKELLR